MQSMITVSRLCQAGQSSLWLTIISLKTKSRAYSKMTFQQAHS